MTSHKIIKNCGIFSGYSYRPSGKLLKNMISIKWRSYYNNIRYLLSQFVCFSFDRIKIIRCHDGDHLDFHGRTDVRWFKHNM